MQLCCSGTKGPALFEDDDLYEDFNMDEVGLNFENYEELFGVTLNHSEELLENGGIDSLFGTKDMSAADSNCQGAVAAEVLISFYHALCCAHFPVSIIVLVFFRLLVQSILYFLKCQS